MTATSGSAWLIVDHSSRDRTRWTGADKRPRSILDSPTLEEIRQQQELFDYYRPQKREFERSDWAQQTSDKPTNASPRPRRLVKSFPGTDIGKATRNPTVSSTGATVADSVINVPFLPPLPPIPSISADYRRVYATSYVQPATVPGAPPRSKIGPAHQKAEAGLLNVTTIGVAGPSMPTPQLPRYCSFPVLQVPPELPLEPSPPGYDFALDSHIRPEVVALRPLRLLSLGKCRLLKQTLDCNVNLSVFKMVGV